ncbi:MarR family winged helix-turn-helix transcriptional regulator [Subdoligranulum variabile]|uniref:Transcriptional regulator, MarR family n=1 Tax=Subdoligranulum variabile DSM 15176 TaxID=411471 RepID=D1PS81_9FIRM|nr:MarR family winged helix-turn-helix transcriptional regulator [Subdoligranulum variabile]EFB74458.1 transcriptional regulator, MarR family [Subdoligranulum variabile DSM 15176]UWP69490.1 MarR family winged helix-turn-helix transcriptional regulator [Subdoligranulum variabile]
MQHDRHAARYVSKLSNKLRRRIDAFSTRGKMSGSQGRALHFLLAQQDDVFQKDIEDEFSLRPSSATELLKAMEREGLIRREPLPRDARRKRIVVTDKALAYKQAVMADILGLEAELTRDIPPEDLEVFFRVMEQMLRNMH